MNKRILVLIVFIWLFCFGAKASEIEIQSRWSFSGKDSSSDAWQDFVVGVSSQKVVLSVFNDARYLYLYLCCWDESLIREMVVSGFTVWFNYDQDSKKIGIRYPIGIQNIADPDSGGQKIPLKDRTIEKLDLAFNRLEVILSKDNSLMRSLSFFKRVNLEVSLVQDGKNFIYRLKIPLVRTVISPYAIYWGMFKRVKVFLDLGREDFSQAFRLRNEFQALPFLSRIEKMPSGGFGEIGGFAGGLYQSREQALASSKVLELPQGDTSFSAQLDVVLAKPPAHNN